MADKSPDNGGKRFRNKQPKSIPTGTIIKLPGEITVKKGAIQEKVKVELKTRVVKTTHKSVTICYEGCSDPTNFEAWIGGRNFRHQVTLTSPSFESFTTEALR